MGRRIRTAVLIGTLTLATLGTASAQLMVPPGARGLAAYTGVATPFGFQPGVLPSDWYVPQVLVRYDMPPQVVYFPMAVGARRPAIEPIQTMGVMLRSGTPLAEIRVKPGMVVTWTNGENRPHTLVLVPPDASEESSEARRQSSEIRANANVSLAFNQPGVYRYYLQDRPEAPARLIVEER